MRIGDPGMTRTCDLRFRKPSLYPAELRDRSPARGAKGLAASYQSGRVIASPSGEPFLRLDVVVAHDLAPDADLFGEEGAKIPGVGEQQRHLLGIAQLGCDRGIAQNLADRFRHV